MRAAVLCAVLLLAGCGVPSTRGVQTTPAELQLLEYLTRDPYVQVTHLERDDDGHLLIVTQQGNGRRRFLIAPDAPTSDRLRLRPLRDACTLDTADNDTPGGGPPPRGLVR
jgi:hypothetical protein